MPRGIPGSKAPHGTVARYQGHACRCRECRTAWRTFSQTYYGRIPREQYLANLPPLRHGTESMYKDGCRCDECRAASAADRRRRRVTGSGPKVHGLASSFKNGCRCDECREAMREYRREYRARTRAAA